MIMIDKLVKICKSICCINALFDGVVFLRAGKAGLSGMITRISQYGGLQRSDVGLRVLRRSSLRKGFAGV